MVAIGVNQSRIGGKPYGIVLTGIDRPVRVKIQGRYECNNGVQFCACGYRGSEWPSGPKGRRFKSCHLDQINGGLEINQAAVFLCPYARKPLKIGVFLNQVEIWGRKKLHSFCAAPIFFFVLYVHYVFCGCGKNVVVGGFLW